MTLPHEIDVAIIGAGAAGLAAARVLETSRLSVAVFEARNRIGGRAHTVDLGQDRLKQNIHFDLGCGWLHSADKNPFVAIAENLDIALDKSRAPWFQQAFDLGFSKAEQAEFRAALDAFWERLEKIAAEPRDVAAIAALEDGNKWNAAIDAISTYINATELKNVSAKDADAYEDTSLNWRATHGYGALIAAHDKTAPVMLETPVSLIDHSGPKLRIVSSKGEIFARAAIIAVPTNLIAHEGVKFFPALDAKREAASQLPLGAANKIMLALDEPEAFAPDSHLHGSVTKTDTGIYHLRPFGRATIEGYFGGTLAHDLEGEGAEGFAAFARDELASLLGSDFRKKIHMLAASSWSSDAFSQGAWSYAVPGHADARARLAAPLQDRLFFAGEATSPNFFSTAHGAHETGLRAAQEVLAALA